MLTMTREPPDLLTQLREQARVRREQAEMPAGWTSCAIEGLRQLQIAEALRSIYRRPLRRDSWRRT